MSGKIVTREFSIDDYDATLQLWQRVEGLEVAEGDDKEGVAQFVTRNPGLSRVAIDGSKIVGVAMCGHDGRRGYIYHVAVDPAYRRYGLGKRLVQECLDGLRRVGIMRALLRACHLPNNAAIRNDARDCAPRQAETTVGQFL